MKERSSIKLTALCELQSSNVCLSQVWASAVAQLVGRASNGRATKTQSCLVWTSQMPAPVQLRGYDEQHFPCEWTDKSRMVAEWVWTRYSARTKP